MKKACSLCVLFVLLFPLLITAQDQEETPQAQKARVLVDKARIYLESNPYSFVIDTVGRGTVVTLFQTGKQNKKWLYISYYSKKRMAQVTGFIDINLVEIINEKPENTETIEEKSVLPSEAESTSEEKEEAQEEQTQATLEKEESTKAEKELPDIQKELTAQKNELKEIEKESGEEEKRDQTESEEKAGIEKETAAQTKPLTESAQEEQESFEEEQKIAQAVEQESTEKKDVKTEQKEEAEEQTEIEETGSEAAKESEKQAEEIAQEVLTKITIKVRKANIRLMPSLKSAVIHQLPFGVELKPLAKSGNWYRVNLPPNPDGITLSGYIHDSIVNETFEKQILAPPEPEEPPESEPEIPGEEPEPVHEPSQDIQHVERTGSAFPAFWIGGGTGYTLPSESNFEKGINFGGTLGFEITRYLAVELRVPYYQSNVTGSIGGLSTGQFQSISLSLSVQARYPIKNLIIPYLVGGGDYYLNKFNLDDDIVNSWNAMGFDIEESVDHTFGFHFGGGLDLFILRNLALNLDVRYSTASVKGEWRLADTISQLETTGPLDNIKLNSIQAGISVKFFLNR